MRDPATRRVLQARRLDPDALALVQEAVKSSDNFALVRRWRCLSACSLNASSESRPVVVGNGHQVLTVTTEP